MSKKDDLDAVFENAPGLLDGEDVALPSLAELLGYLKLSEVIDLDRLIKHQQVMYKKFNDESKIENSPRQFIGFIIPLDSYIPLSDNYGANVVYPDAGQGISRVSLISIANTPIKVSAGEQDIKWRLTVMFVALGDLKVTGKTIEELGKSGKLFRIYDHAIEAANDAINAYKMTPARHNHDLHPVSVLNRPSSVEVIRFDMDKSDLLEHEHVSMHKNMFLSAQHARKMLDKELENFRNLHLAISGQFRLESVIISKIYQAIDARCVGNEAYAIVLADTYAEHALSYLLFQMLIPDMGAQKAGEAVEKIQKIDKLVQQLARKLTLTPSELKRQIDYQDWQEKCRYIRNPLTHVFLEQRPSQEQAQEAIDSTINMVYKLVEIVEGKYEQSKPVLQFFKSVNWHRTLRNRPASK